MALNDFTSGSDLDFISLCPLAQGVHLDGRLLCFFGAGSDSGNERQRIFSAHHTYSRNRHGHTADRRRKAILDCKSVEEYIMLCL